MGDGAFMRESWLQQPGILSDRRFGFWEPSVQADYVQDAYTMAGCRFLPPLRIGVSNGQTCRPQHERLAVILAISVGRCI
jgi:hypothetical protein